ncbi:cysteine hydrolase family protein [Nocardia sp. BMG111209]|uniref:cysteine hydrolase family protein n=1 Tax=Nocardia sp. BMG111209 TaxID=1160137 RepID=UPI00037BE685|nr:isochorismatase family cysteine hydrolase [Nocardia sp. BMG111209]
MRHLLRLAVAVLVTVLPATGFGVAPSNAGPVIDPTHTALLVMDMQQGIVAMSGASADPLTAHIAAAEQAVRQARSSVVFVRTAFTPGYPEVSPHNKAFAGIAGTGKMLDGSPETAFDPRIAPAGDEPVITKHRVGAFGSTPLDRTLHARNIDTIVLTGLATSGVVLSTVRAAADLDYHVVVLSDGVADTDPEVNRVLLDTVFPPQADVIDTTEFIRELNP